MSRPVVLQGGKAIGAHLGIAPKQAQHLHDQRHIPSFRLPGDPAPQATVGSLDEWRQLPGAAALASGEHPS